MAETLEQRLREIGRGATAVDTNDCRDHPDWVIDRIAELISAIADAADALAPTARPEKSSDFSGKD